PELGLSLPDLELGHERLQGRGRLGQLLIEHRSKALESQGARLFGGIGHFAPNGTSLSPEGTARWNPEEITNSLGSASTSKARVAQAQRPSAGARRNDRQVT